MLSHSFIKEFGGLITWVVSSFLIFFRYLLVAGIAYLIFYKWKKIYFLSVKIQTAFPTKIIVLKEVRNSIFSCVIFGLFMLLIIGMNSYGITLLYQDVAKYGYVYLFFSLMLLIIIHDTYFYWSHRLMHHRKLFPIMHHVHHQSYNPTPWASFSFHPFEAIVEFAFLPVVVCCLPLHPLAILLWSVWMILWNVVGHLGYELFPKGFTRHPIFKWFNTSTHHNLHHQRSRGNFGLYFNWWDRWMKTNDETYEKVFMNRQKT
jgi:Delta7-sterol 5-desaturase